MEEKKNRNKKVFILIAIMTIIIVTMTASFAIFTYTRSGSELIIKTGKLEFAMIDGTSITLENVFPQSDEDGNKNDAYKFEVRNTSTEGVTLYYNVSLVTNNNDEIKNYFTNDQIKYTLVKNDVIVKNSELVSNIIQNNTSNGEGVVLENQSITAEKTDYYKLKIWISDDVNYSSEPDENGLSTGKYNEYEYSLKVKVDVTSEINNGYSANNVSFTNNEYTACTDVECSLNELYDKIVGE